MTTTVGVTPASAFNERARFLNALAAILPVTFVALDDVAFGEPARQVSAVVAFGVRNAHFQGVPTLVLAGEGPRVDHAPIRFAPSEAVDVRLRGRTLTSDWSPAAALGDLNADSEVLATAEHAPAWVREAGPTPRDLVAGELPELAPSEVLRDRIVPGKCLSMIALVQFLRAASRDQLWTPPDPRACVIFDDPNTRWRTYGYVDYRKLVHDADEHNYHVSFAHIPLDFRFFDQRTLRLFHAAPGRLSLAIHGNNHTPTELASQPAEDADRLLAQALRRTARFEQRSGLGVSRVMIPPHEVCSESVLRSMTRFEFEGMALTRPYRWCSNLESTSPYATPNETPAGFTPADITSFGMPLITRRRLNEHEEITVRAFLDLPIVLYGHEWDLSEGPGVLQRAASLVNKLPTVSWADLASLSRSNYMTQRDGGELHIRPYARRLRIAAVPPEVEALVIHPLVEDGEDRASEHDAHTGDRPLRLSDRERTTLVLDSLERTVDIEIELMSGSRLDRDEVPAPPRRPVYVVRRIATEARDRSHPLRDRLRIGRDDS
jgi:hypothetical protein